jgi:3-oxoacyl-[acyl-carrier-protein] synthase II
MEIAIAEAGVSPRDVRHLNAHATSTLVGDLGEIEAIKSVFGRDSAIAVSATKSATGHLLGAAGGLGAIFTILALRDQVGPPILNLSTPDAAGAGIDFVANQSRLLEMDYAICNGFGFGGVNASALFRRWTDNPVDANAGGSRD